MTEKTKYVVDNDFTPFREISRIATEDGMKMNAATARHILYRGLNKIAVSVLMETQGLSNKEAKELAPKICKALEFQYWVRDAIVEKDMELEYLLSDNPENITL